MTAPLLLDLTHTSHTTARTGVQRVARSLHAALGKRALPICHDPFLRAWRALDATERATLEPTAAASERRGARWRTATRIRGRISALLGGSAAKPVRLSAEQLSGGLLVPEIFSPKVGAALPSLLSATRGPSIAVFHDAIALKLPAISPRKTVARKPAYLRELLEFDGIAATSSASRGMLEEWWDWLGEKRRPAIETIGLGVDPAPTEPSPIPQGVPTVLSVGTIEGRKNHVALLDAAEALWREGLDFELRIVGMVQRETGLEAAARLRELQDLGRPLRHDGALGERAVEQAYRESTFTVYPSVLEGFGLPVIESLSRGRPCICSARGATGESAKGGGCITVDPPDSAGIAAAMRSLISNRSRIEALAAEARTRTFRTWAEYADGLISWMRTL